MFTPIDSFQLARVRAHLLREQGAIFPALEQYGTAMSRLLGRGSARLHQIYKGYRIVLHDRRFYAVPTSVRNFSIYRGIVIRIPGFIDEMKPRVSEGMSPRWRRMLRPVWRTTARPAWRFGRRRVVPRLRRNPVLRFIGRQIYALAMWLYTRFTAVSGVLVEFDVVALRARIDLSSEGTPVGISAQIPKQAA